jgi:hypothetical protein
MKLFLETTKWNVDCTNNAYYLSDDKTKLYAYVRPGESAVRTLKNFIRFDTRGRTFKEIPNTYGYFHDDELKNVSKSWKVKGSKGDEYTITEEENGYTCTCSGFKFRAQCKHIKELENERTH